MLFLLFLFVFIIILFYKIRDKMIFYVDSYLFKEFVQLCLIEVKEIKVQRCMIFYNSLFICFNKCMMNLQVELVMERIILNRLKQIKFFLFIVICLIFVLLDIYVSKKKSFIFDFYVRNVIVFVLMVICRGNVFFIYL